VQEVGVVVVDLEEDDLVIDRDGAEVVLAVRVIVGSEGVEGGNRLVDLEDGIIAKSLDAAGDDDPSATMVFTQLVIKRANAVSSEVMMVSIPKAARRSRCPRSAAAVARRFRFLTFSRRAPLSLRP